MPWRLTASRALEGGNGGPLGQASPYKDPLNIMGHGSDVPKVT